MIHPIFNNKFKICLWIISLLIVSISSDLYASDSNTDFSYKALPFTLNSIKERIMSVDMDGDGLLDFVCSNEKEIRVYFNHASDKDMTEIFNFSRPDLFMLLPGNAVGWNVDCITGKKAINENCPKQLTAVVDGKSVIAWQVKNRKFTEPVTILDGLSGYLPKGAYLLNFIRDINKDGYTDIILPGYRKLHIFLQDDKGNYNGNITIDSAIGVNSSLGISLDLEARAGQRLIIPALNLRDVNNDGHNDLISEVDEVTDVFLGREDESFSLEPSYSIDLNKLLGPPKDVSMEEMDFSNIMANASLGRQQIISDINEDKIEDLILLNEGKVTIYNGTSDGIDFSRPGQVLKSSGNVIAAFVTKELNFDKGSRSNDLVLVRVQDISLGDILSMFIIKKDINIEGFIYKNKGNVFEKRPARKITLTIKIPSIIKIIDLVKELEKMETNSGNTSLVKASLQDNHKNTDRVLFKNDAIQFYLGEHEKEELNEDQISKFLDFISEYGISRDKDHFTIDAEKLLKNIPELEKVGPAYEIKDKKAVFNIDVTPYIKNTRDNKRSVKSNIAAIDLNGDKCDDIILFTDRDETSVYGTMFISQ